MSLTLKDKNVWEDVGTIFAARDIIDRREEIRKRKKELKFLNVANFAGASK
jgi:hypothetical protein